MSNFKKYSLRIVKYILIAAFWLLIWEICAILLNVPVLFPEPLDVIKRLLELAITKGFIFSSFASILRVFSGMLIGIVIGIILAIFCTFFKFAYDIFYPLLTIIKATPIASFVLVIWIFLGDQKTPVIITVLMMLPIVWTNLYEGIKCVDKDLIEVCKSYKLSKFKAFKAVYFPSVIPYFVSSLVSGIGLSWKAGIAAEVLCSPKWSIGEAIFNAKYYFNGVDLFAWTVSVIVLSLIFELLITRLIKYMFRKYIVSTRGKYGNQKSM